MKNILFGLFFSLMAFQVNAGTINISGGFNAGTVQETVTPAGSFSSIHTLELGAGFAYDLDITGSMTPSAQDGVTFTISGAGFGPVLYTLADLPDAVANVAAGTYSIVFGGVATGAGASASLNISGFGTALPVSEVPVPAAAWLFGSALMGMVGVSRRKSASVAA